MKVTVQGYKLNNYDATYEPKDFIFEEYEYNNERAIKIIDADSGMEFWFNVPNEVETPGRKPKRNVVHKNWLRLKRILFHE